MNDRTIFKDFLLSLAQRMSGENDLSDMIYAACHASQLFKHVFVTFFFPEIEETNLIYIEREVTEGSSRVDFIFDYNGKKYIVENKIYDKNHHFGQYESVYKVVPNRFGYIVNYHNIEYEGKTKSDYLKLGYRIKSWEEFYKHLIAIEDQDDIIAPIAGYIKSVCSIILTKDKMNFTALNTLPTFLRMLNPIFGNASNNRYSSDYYKNNEKQETSWGGNIISGHDNCIVGRYFEVKFNKVRGKYNTTWGWMGIWFNDPEQTPTICIGIREDKNWSGKAYELLESKISASKSESYKGWYIENGCVWRDLPDEKFKTLEECESLEKQQVILSDFYKKSINIIADLIDGK